VKSLRSYKFEDKEVPLAHIKQKLIIPLSSLTKINCCLRVGRIQVSAMNAQIKQLQKQQKQQEKQQETKQ